MAIIFNREELWQIEAGFYFLVVEVDNERVIFEYLDEHANKMGIKKTMLLSVAQQTAEQHRWELRANSYTLSWPDAPE